MKEIRVVYNKIDFETYDKVFEELLSKVYPERREAVLRLKNREAACVSLGAGLLLQSVLEKKLGIEPKDIVLAKTDNGKPYLEDYPDFYFNISHSGDMIFIAYGNSPVGIDVEKLRCSDKDMQMAKRCFTDKEYEYIVCQETINGIDSESEPLSIDSTKELKFTSVWTMKEAYLKYKGTGISIPLNSFEVDLEKGSVEGENVKITRMQIGEYMFSICTDDDCEAFF